MEGRAQRQRFPVPILALTALAAGALAQGNPLFIVNEHGVGSITFPGNPPIDMPGVLAADPGPGGLPSALTYNLLGPPSLVAGDLFIQEVAGGAFSDVVRFNPAGTGGSGYNASLAFPCLHTPTRFCCLN